MSTAGAAVVRCVNAIATAIEADRDWLTELDSAIGDADHGGNMARGWAAAAAAVGEFDDPTPETVVKQTGRTLMAEVGGAAGPLYGGSLLFASAELADGLTTETAVAFAETYLEKLTDRGGARLGDATMVDAVTPAVHSLRAAIEVDGATPVAALAAAVTAARRGMAGTVGLRANKGRASYLGWRSVGHQDPGATSTVIICETILEVLADELDEAVPSVPAVTVHDPDA